jgi:uncharacterized membrane protein YeaQ/YmgE (transglycosylase-associated protein family)
MTSDEAASVLTFARALFAVHNTAIQHRAPGEDRRPQEPNGMLGTNSLIVVLLVGLVAGWLAGKIVQGTGLGLIGDIIIGVIGAFIGRWLFTYFHLRIGVNFWVDAILTATAGAVVLLLILRLVRR